MPRSGSGSYTLPSGNPVVTGTTIESNWANTTLSDIATTLTDSLSRSGQGGMTAALRVADGTQGAPGVGFANETGSGFYRAGTGEVWAVVQGAQTLNLDANGVYVPADKTTTVDGAFVFNEAGADKDARFEGDTDANLLFLDASTDRVGVGTNTPDAKLTVNGVGAFGDGAVGAPSIANTGDLNTGIWFPAADTVAVSTGGVEAAHFDSSGNLGLGVTPSAWGSGLKAIQFGSQASIYATSSAIPVFSNNIYYNGSNNKYIASATAGRYYINGNSHIWDISTDVTPTAGNNVTLSQAMTLDASGNLSIGATSPPANERLYVTGAINSGAIARITNTNNAAYSTTAYSPLATLLINNPSTTASTAAGITFITTGSGLGSAASIGAVATNASGYGNALVFQTRDTTGADGERARITSGGDLLVGDTTGNDGRVRVDGTANTNNCAVWGKTSGGATSPTAVWWNNATTGDNLFERFYTEGTATLRGSISYNRTGGLVAYNTTSDYRAKDIIGPVLNPGATIDALKVYEGQMKGATQSRPMLVAHEAQAVAPYCVTGEKDAVDADGKPVYQQMDVSSLVPLLLAEIQSLRARVAALEAKP